MSITFYPYSGDVKGSLDEKIEILMDAAERFKAAMLDVAASVEPGGAIPKRMMPREIKVAYNWEEIARVLREIRELSEGDKSEKTIK